MSEKEAAKPNLGRKNAHPAVAKGQPEVQEVGNRPVPFSTALSPTRQQQTLLQLQRQRGNHFVQRFIQREVNYNVQDDNGQHADPEEMDGVLEFTEDGWDGIAIGQRVSQINSATPHFDESRCALLSGN
jgi:hypothetical protein